MWCIYRAQEKTKERYLPMPPVWIGSSEQWGTSAQAKHSAHTTTWRPACSLPPRAGRFHTASCTASWHTALGCADVPQGCPAHLVALVERKVIKQSAHREQALGACMNNWGTMERKQVNGRADPPIKAQGSALGMATSSGHGSSAGPRNTKSKFNFACGTKHTWEGDAVSGSRKADKMEAQSGAGGCQQSWTYAPEGDSFCPWKQGISVEREYCGYD